MTIRPATEADLPAINDIYNHYVETCTCTWQLVPDTLADRQAWFSAHADGYPVLVAEEDGEVVAWAALSPYRQRAGYRPTAEVSVYVRDDRRGRGLGTVLLRELVARAKTAGFHSLVAVISGDREASIRLHAKHGFREAGRLREAGLKFGKRLDVVTMQLMLGSPETSARAK